MRHFIIILLIFSPTLFYGQKKEVVGTYRSAMPRVEVILNEDSAFEYIAKEGDPTFYRWEDFSEKGKWTLHGDTIILNPQLPKEVFVESEFIEQENPKDTGILLTFNHIKRHFDLNGKIIKTDTFQIYHLDYSFNELKKKKRTRVAPHLTTRCTFAGYIPKETVTKNRTISIQKPVGPIKSIFIGCYELKETKEFIVTNPNSNHLTLNVYSNYYQDGQIRQMKFLIKNNRYLYTRQKGNGKFEKDNIWLETNAKLKRVKGNR